jgi:PAS domain S-box-containing protein
VACCTIDTSGFIRDCNDLFASLFTYPRKDLVNASFLDLAEATPDNVLHKTLERLQDQTGIFSQRVWLRRKDGSTFPALLNIKPLEDKHGSVKGGSVVVIDDTFNYRAIAGAEKDKEELKRKERLKNEFVAIASHELRTPIQPILGFALLAKRGSISQETAWEGVLSEARRLQQLANDILDVSRIESDNLKYEFSRVKINELVRHAVESLTGELNKDISVQVDQPESDTDLLIDADRSRITQVITNLVGNAIKFTSKGTIKVESKAYFDKNRLEIRISDTGGGIPTDILPRLFEKFVTKDHGEGNKKGSGLGLYISKAIVTAHNGELTATNNPEGGATFLISLPINRQVQQSVLK